MEKKENAKRRIFRTMLLAALVVAAFLITGKGTVKVQAAGYVSMRIDNTGHHDPKYRTKSGKYYFKQESNRFYISTSKNGPYRETPLNQMGFASNGKQAYFIKDGHYLYRYVYASGESYYVQDLPIDEPRTTTYSIGAAQGNRLYLTRGSEFLFQYDTFLYNVKGGKIRLLKRDCAIIDRFKDYVISADTYRTGMGAASYTLYKLSASGLQKVKNITTKGAYANFAGGNLYYDVFDRIMAEFTFYKARPDGTGVVKIHHVDGGSSASTYMAGFTSKYCEYYVNGHLYRYTYATGKVTSVPR